MLWGTPIAIWVVLAVLLACLPLLVYGLYHAGEE